MGTIIQYVFYLEVLVLLAIPLGRYISKAMNGEKVFLTRILAPCEKGIYKVLHIDPEEDMSWKKYLVSVLAFSGFVDFWYCFFCRYSRNSSHLIRSI